MADGFVKVAPDSSGKIIDTSELTVGANTVERQRVVLSDPAVAAALATISQFHNSDNQALPGTAYGLLAGGVAQLLNAIGNLDRQRETGYDGIPAVGIATGSMQEAQYVFNSTATGITAAATTATLTLTNAIGAGASQTIFVGSVVTLDTGSNAEPAWVTAATGSSITVAFPPGGAKFTHSGTYNVASYVYNQSRDAAGELDGASGKGTAVALEYEYNGGGPVLASGLPSGFIAERARSLNAKGQGTATCSSTTAGNTSLTIGTPSQVNTLTAGAAVQLSGSGTTETVYVRQDYVSGTSPVNLQSPVVNTGQTTLTWDQYASNGPGLSGFTPFGVGIEEEALYDPVSGLYYVERSATQDNVSGQNVVMESEALCNSNQSGVNTVDRARSNLAITLLASAARTTTQTSTDQLNVNGHCLHVILNVTSAGTGSITVSINGKDPASGVYYNLLTGTAVTGNGTTVYKVGPALTAAANSIANDWVPRTFQIVVTANNANSVTYSVGYNLSE